MVAACCSNCDRNVWVSKDDDIDIVTEDVSRGVVDDPVWGTPVGGRVWCNSDCYDEWLGSSGGVQLSDELIQDLADEAEDGYDDDQLTER